MHRLLNLAEVAKSDLVLPSRSLSRPESLGSWVGLLTRPWKTIATIALRLWIPRMLPAASRLSRLEASMLAPEMSQLGRIRIETSPLDTVAL